MALYLIYSFHGHSFQFADKIERAKLDSAIEFLENQLTPLSDVYELAIVSFALQLVGSDQASTAWDKLDQKSHMKGECSDSLFDLFAWITSSYC